MSLLDSLWRPPILAYMAGLAEIHAFSPSLVNELRLGYTRLPATLQQEQNADGAFTFQNTPTSFPSLYPTLAFAGYGIFGDGAISDRNFELDESGDFSDALSFIHCNHEFKAGFELLRAHFYNTVNLNAAPWRVVQRLESRSI